MRKIGKYVLTTSLLLNQVSPLLVSATELEESKTINEETSVKTEAKNVLDQLDIIEKVEEFKVKQINDSPIDVSSIAVSTKNATVGDEVIYSLAIPGMTDLNVSIELRNLEMGESHYLYLEYNQATERYEGTWTISQFNESGSWSVDRIYYTDYSDYDGSLYNSNSPYRDELSSQADLSAYNLNVNGTTPDYESPVIDKEGIKVSQNEATIGSEIKYSIPVSDDTNIESVYLTLYNLESKKEIMVYGDYEVDTKTFNGILSVDNNLESGVWSIKEIGAYDAASNSTYLYNEAHPYYTDYEEATDLSTYNVVISGTTPDYESPIIIKEGINLSQNEGTVGNEIQYSIPVSDNVSIDSVYLTLYHLESKKELSIYGEYDVDTGIFTAPFSITNNTESGVWGIKQIVAYDTASNATSLYNQDHPDAADYEGSTDLSAFNLLVSGTNPDYEYPVINIDSLSVSHKEAKSGDAIRYEVEITDNTGIELSTIELVNPETHAYNTIYLSYNDEVGKFVGEFNVDLHSTENGYWKIDKISAYDSAHLDAVYYNSVVERYEGDTPLIDLSKFDVLVSGNEVEHEPPFVDIENLKVNKKHAVFGDIITYSIPATDNNEISHGEIYLTNEKMGEDSHQISFNYNDVLKVYEASMKVNKNVLAGEWRIGSIDFYDASYNMTRFYNENKEYYEGTAVNLEEYNVFIEALNPSSVPSTKQLEPLEVKQRQVDKGVKIEYAYPSEELEFSRFILHLKEDGRDIPAIEMKYNKETKQFQGETNNFYYGELIQVSAVELWTEEGSYSVFKNEEYFPNDGQSVDLSKFDIEIVATELNPPVIKPESLTINTNSANVGEKIVFGVSVEESVPLKGGAIVIASDKGNTIKEAKFILNKEKGQYEASFDINKNYSNGEWHIEYLYFEDKAAQRSYLYNDFTYEDYGDSVDLSKLNFKVTNEKYDSEAPKVDIKSLSMKKEKIGSIEEVVYSIKASDNERIDYGGIMLHTPYFGDMDISYYGFKYNKEKDVYEARIPILENSHPGTYEVVSVYFYDKNQNATEFSHTEYNYNGEKVDFGYLNFEVEASPNIDETKPVIDYKDISMSYKEAKPGTEITISVPITDNRDISSASIDLVSPVRNKIYTLDLVRNEKTKRYEAKFTIDKGQESGLWKIDRIIATDMFGNYTEVANAENYWQYGIGVDLQDYDFNVIDTTPVYTNPILQMDTLEIIKNEVSLGEEYTFRLKLGDDRTIQHAEIVLFNRISEKYHYTLFNYNLKTGYYEAKGNFIESDEIGDWEIHNLSFYDSNQNLTFVYNLPHIYLDGNDGIALDLSKYQLHVQVNEPIIKATDFDVMIHSKEDLLQFATAEDKIDGDLTNKLKIEASNVDVSKRGTYEVTYSVVNSHGKSTSKTVNVRVIQPEVTELKLELEKVTLQVNEVQNLKYSIVTQDNPKYELKWKSSNPVVATVDNKGNVTALAAGTTVIEVTDGNKKDSVTVTVGAPSITYSTHIQKDGWQETKKDGQLSGTEGQAKRLEGIKIKLENLPYQGSIEYQTHVQSYGWMDWAKNGTLSGTEGKAKRLEGIRIKLSGEVAKHYDIYYRVHAQSYGWLDWAKNGEDAGSEGLAKRLEAIEIKLVKKGETAPGKTTRPYVKSNASISYTTHVQKQGWQNYVKNGKMSGTSGKAMRLEGIKVQVSDSALSGGVQYRTHVQKAGWQNWKSNDVMSGTSGKALRLEAIELKLTGELAEYYDVYYRVHAQSYGWLGWAKNGQSAGTEGLAKRLEGIEIKLVRKGEKAPGSTVKAFIKK